jgi:hypothetical protein
LVAEKGGVLGKRKKGTSWTSTFRARPGARRVSTQAAAQRDAPICAKAKIMEEDALDRSASDYRTKRDAILVELLKKSPAEVKAKMSNMRGFSS